MIKIRKEYKLSFFRIKINWLIAVCVLLTSAGLARLGLWQLDRAGDKYEQQRLLEAQSSQNAEAIESIPRGHLHRANPDIQNRHVLLRGKYINDRTILLPGEFFDGQIGYGVVTPLRLASDDTVVLVNRGWTTGILPPNTAPRLLPYMDKATITAQIYVPPENARVIPSEIDPNSWPVRLRTLELGVVEQLLGEEVFPFELRLTKEQHGTLIRHWPAVNPDVDQNLSYAVQWFAFALIVLLVSVFSSSNLWAILKGPSRGS
jgi:surfeit locus 1 family protein